MNMPPVIAHADWGTNPKKRQVAVAELSIEGYYNVESLAPAQTEARMGGDLRFGLNVTGAGQLLVGFDLPLGFPRAYAERAGIISFPDFLPSIGSGPWQRFAEVAVLADEVSLQRPFYPARPGGTLQSHLYDGLGLTREQIRRRCDGNDAATMFWTLGGNQVGKAALAGWSYLSAVPAESIRYWPFHGSLTTLLDGDPNTTVVAETYPRLFYEHFRSGFSGKGSKTKREDRLRWIPGLLRWADSLGVTWRSEIFRQVEAGFSDDITGEDQFDAVVGLLGMISVVTGAVKPGEPQDDPAVTSVEGWMLGRRPDRSKRVTADHNAINASWRKLAALPQEEEQRASIEATTARLITSARTAGYSDDEVMRLVERILRTT